MAKLKMDGYDTAVSERLATVRKVLGLNQAQAAERAGVSRQSICAFESRRSSPTVTMLHRLATAYGVSMAWIVGAVDEVEVPLSDKDGCTVTARITCPPMEAGD